MTDDSGDSKGGRPGPYRSDGLERSGLSREDVRNAMSRVPRHRFVPEPLNDLAYDDRALPIGCGQTISQPYIVALMTENAEVMPGSKVLEVGTGSGYQAAVLSELGAKVFSVEIIPELSHRAASVLKELGYDVQLRTGDGWEGWPSEAPFDAILVTAASPRVPDRLLAQLGEGGRMVVPIERDDFSERLVVIVRTPSGLEMSDLGGVKFVPLTGEVRGEVHKPTNGPHPPGQGSPQRRR